MNCLKCQTETSGDYPACSTCTPHMHFMYRADCRCQDAECTAKRLSANGGTHSRLSNGNAIDIARQMVANGKASERMKSELHTLDKHARIIAQAEAEGFTVHSNIHTFHKCALRWIEGAIVKMNQINSGSLVRVAEAAPDEEADPWLTYSPSPNDDAGTGHFDGLTAIEESKRTLVY